MAKRTRQHQPQTSSTDQQESSEDQASDEQTNQPIIHQEAPVTEEIQTPSTDTPKKQPRTKMQKALGSVVAAMTPAQRNAIVTGDSEAVAGLVVALQTEVSTFVERIKDQMAALERQLAGPVAEQNGAADEGEVVAEMIIEKENVSAD